MQKYSVADVQKKPITRKYQKEGPNKEADIWDTGFQI